MSSKAEEPERPVPITPDEVRSWLPNNRIKNRPLPSNEQLAPLLEMLNDCLIFEFGTRFAESKGICSNSKYSISNIRVYGFHLLENLRNFQYYGDGLFDCMGISSVKIAALLRALEEVEDFLTAPTKPKRGAKVQRWHAFAHAFAPAIASVLKAAGWPQPSLTRGDGPVARIGARAIERVLGEARIDPSTFASAVKSYAARDPLKIYRQGARRREGG